MMVLYINELLHYLTATTDIRYTPVDII